MTINRQWCPFRTDSRVPPKHKQIILSFWFSIECVERENGKLCQRAKALRVIVGLTHTTNNNSSTSPRRHGLQFTFLILISLSIWIYNRPRSQRPISIRQLRKKFLVGFRLEHLKHTRIKYLFISVSAASGKKRKKRELRTDAQCEKERRK